MQEKNKFAWETLDATTILNPLEIVAYHVYNLELNNKLKREKSASKDLKILKTYLNDTKDREVKGCSEK